jgi:hypothetical protein
MDAKVRSIVIIDSGVADRNKVRDWKQQSFIKLAVCTQNAAPPLDTFVDEVINGFLPWFKLYKDGASSNLSEAYPSYVRYLVNHCDNRNPLSEEVFDLLLNKWMETEKVLVVKKKVKKQKKRKIQQEAVTGNTKMLLVGGVRKIVDFDALLQTSTPSLDG